MRDPVARAVSQYNQLAKLGRINKSIDEAFSDELEILQAAAGDPDRAGQLCFDSGKACLWRSLYVVFLDRWLQRYPAEQLLTLRSEDYFGDAEATMRRVWGFLGMQASSTPASAMSNQGEKTASPSAELTMRLRAFFQPYNRRLSERVGWDCRWD
jgi:hypothetical protein